MIVIDNGRAKGFTIFFPGILANGRTFLATNLSSAMRHVTLHITIQLSVLFAWYISIETGAISLNYVALAMFCYVALRIFFVRRIPFNVGNENLLYSLAPIPIWIDHTLYYLMLVCVIASTSVPQYFVAGVIVEAAVVALGVAPIFSLFVYRRFKRKRNAG